MSKIDGSALMFDEEQVRTTRSFLPRLIRIIFYGLSISNNDYISRYQRHIRATTGSKGTRESNQKLASDRKFLQDKHNLTFKLMNAVLVAMGLDIECISFRLRDRITDEVRTFSTDDTVDSLKAELEKEKTIGIQNLFGTPVPTHENTGAISEIREGNHLYVILNIVRDKDKDLMSDVGTSVATSVDDALDNYLEESIEINENVEEVRLVVEELRKVPVGTPVKGMFTNDVYLVVKIPDIT